MKKDIPSATLAMDALHRSSRARVLLLLLSLLLASCSEWLDVTPSARIKASDNFDTPRGFQDALAGIYMLMTEPACYGQELSFGMVDVLGKQYTTDSYTSNPYYYLFRYDYTADASKTKIAATWSAMYTAIANVNSLISYIDKADSTMFLPDEYNVIRGEAHALRAFLHFDLLRLFGPSYLVAPDALAIPYIKVFSSQVTPLSTVRQVIDAALADLEIAGKELARDPVTRGVSSADFSDFLRDRHYHFNYYAVKLLQARVYLYKGDHRNARSAAEEVIAQQLFTWAPESTIATVNAEARNYLFWPELIFTLNMNNITELAFGPTGFPALLATSGSGGLNKSVANWNAAYEVATYPNDYRNAYLLRALDTYGGYVTSNKLHQPTAVYGQEYLDKMPVMRLPEAYYIAAEAALYLQDKEAAVYYLNEARAHRNIHDPIAATLADEIIHEEIRKEHVKEFICEGQLFYYYKRRDSETIQFYNPGATGLHPRDIYVLPLPDDEIEFGYRYLETE